MIQSSPRQLKAVYRLVTDVCQLGDDAESWTNRLMTGLAELFEARMVALSWAYLPSGRSRIKRGEVELQHGFTQDEQRLWVKVCRGSDGAFHSESIRHVANIRARFVTVRRQDLMDDKEWYALPAVKNGHRRLDIDANLSSVFASVAMRRSFGIAIHRAWGKPQFTVKERRRLRLLHLELARVWRDRIARPDDQDPTIRTLSPRLQQVLWLLCLGRSEKEIARQLVLSTHTIHNHVQRLHHKLSVSSRGELLARALTGCGGQPVALRPREMNIFGLS